jgi:hypothetical protein
LKNDKIMTSDPFIYFPYFRDKGEWFGETHLSPQNSPSGFMWSQPETTVYFSAQFQELSFSQVLPPKQSPWKPLTVCIQQKGLGSILDQIIKEYYVDRAYTTSFSLHCFFHNTLSKMFLLMLPFEVFLLIQGDLRTLKN